ncbi:MAG TPA: TolC family protein [bacterium]|nr:TolC family protein [bacterium]HPS31854.1 TolC family protein [bacterium]
MRKLFISFLFFIPFLLLSNELSLDECIANSVNESEKIKSAEAGAEAAKAGKNALIFSFLPTSTIEANYQWLKFDPKPEPTTFDLTARGKGVVEFGAIPDKSRTLGMTIVQPITPLWSVFNGFKSADLGHEISKLQKDLSIEQIKLEVMNLYYNYEMLSESMKVMSETKEQLKRYYNQANNFVNAGLSDKRAVLKIDIELARLDQQIQIITGNMKLIKKNLSIFMNVPTDSFTLKNIKLSRAQLSANNTELEDLMLKNRIELKMLQKSSAIAKHMEWMAVQPFIPTFAIAGGFKKTWDDSQFQPAMTMFIGGSLSWNIGFDWGKSGFELLKAKKERVKTDLDNLNSKKMLGLQLVQLENDVETKYKAIEISKREIASATENLRIEEDKYREKLTTETELLDASVSLRAAKLKLLTSTYEHEVALNRLAITVGVPYENITETGGN